MKSKEAQLPGIKAKKLRIYVHPRSPSGKWVAAIGACAALLAGTGLIAGGIWLGLRLIVNPNTQVLLSRFFPESTRLSAARREFSQTYEQIKAEIVQKQLIPGEPLFLNPSATKSDLLLPVLAMRPQCQTNCEQIVELRVYRPTNIPTRYRLASVVAVTGLDESFVLAPLNNGEDKINSSRSLPVTAVSSIDDKAPAPGFWINLSGTLAQADTSIAYGHLLHYNPSSDSLSLILSWTSPSGQAPYWQEVTGGGTPELVVNQTVGMEPQYRAYQIVPYKFPDSIYIEEIALSEPTLDSEIYRQGMMLAENGLWSAAWEWLQALNKKKLPAITKAQIDLIRLHAQFTETQSRATWASPSQQVNAFLINGDWQEAIDVFESSDYQNRYEIVTSLKTDSGRLWQRVEAAIAVKPTPAVKSWGALIKAAQQGSPVARAWLRRQPENTPETMSEVEQLLAQLDMAQTQALASNSHFSQIMGNAKQLTQVNPAAWLQPTLGDEQALQLQPQQVWYQVQVSAFNDGQRWYQAPFSDLKLPSVEPGLQLWRLLGLNTDSQILLTVWTPDGKPQTTIGTVKAVQLEDGALQLLASGEQLQQASPKVLAYTQAALDLLEPNYTTLSELNQKQPLWISGILPALWRELQSAGYVKLRKSPSAKVMLQIFGDLQVQTHDFTGNNKPEAVLTIADELVAQSKYSTSHRLANGSQILKPRTLIFSDAGKILYSEFTKNSKEFFAGVAEFDGGTPALVVDDSTNYSLKRWSARGQRFD